MRSVFPRYAQICKSSVDLPMPGAPPTRISDPRTPPPPRTRSSSCIPVEKRISCSPVTSLSFFGAEREKPDRPAALAAGVFLSSNSMIEFQAPHAGHWPCQRGVSLPHCLQIKTVLDFIRMLL